MRTVHVRVLVVVAALGVGAGCSKKHEDTKAGAKAGAQSGTKAEPGAQATKAKPGAVMKHVLTPAADSCAVLTETLVRRTFDLSDKVKLERGKSTGADQVCAYQWDKPNADKLRAELHKKEQEHVKQMMKQLHSGKMGQGLTEMAKEVPTVKSQVSLILSNFHFDSKDNARTSFQSSMKKLNDGIKREVSVPGKKGKHEEVVAFRLQNVPVKGVGDLAAWSPKIDQLTVLDGKRIFHVRANIHTDADENLVEAKKLAQAVIDALHHGETRTAGQPG